MTHETIAIVPPESALEYTGERYTTAATGEIKHEHYHRYLFARQFCHRKVVLDIASGEGYGSALLGTVAAQVVGIDLAAEAVRHASVNYGSETVSFAAGNCAAIPASDASVDVIISFETLEHIAEQDRFLREIKRVLRYGGVLILSTPNTTAYKDIATTPNPFHVKELHESEFRAAISMYFGNYRVFGQRSVVGSAIAPVAGELSGTDRQQSFHADDAIVYSIVPGIGQSTYLIAVASDTPLPTIQHGLLDDRPFLMNLYERLQDQTIAVLQVEHQLRGSEALRAATQGNIDALQSALVDVTTDAQSRSDLAESYRDALRRDRLLAHRLMADLDRVNADRDRVNIAFNDVVKQLRERDLQLADSRRRTDEIERLVALVYSSHSWRLSRPIRLSGRILRALKRRAARIVEKLRRSTVADLSKEGVGGVAPSSSSYNGSEPADRGIPEGGEEHDLQVLADSELFDEDYYLKTYSDVAASGLSPIRHFYCCGCQKGWRPNAYFDPAYYREAYPDVADAGIDPVLHYYQSGAAEGRMPSADFDTRFYLDSNHDVAASGMNPLVHFLRYGAAEGRLPRARHTVLVTGQPTRPRRGRSDRTARHASFHKKPPTALGRRPLISVLMPTYNTQPVYLEAAVKSVIAQIYPVWELRIVDDGSTAPATLEALDRIVTWDERILVTRDAANSGIARATNVALFAAHGDYVAMLDHDDEITEDALHEVVLALDADPSIDVVYTDQDYVSPDGAPAGLLLKPDWSPQFFRGVMFVGHLLIVRRSVAIDIGGFDPNYDFVQDFEFMLRVSERTQNIRHLPQVLYHWRRIPQSVASGGKAAHGIECLQAAAVQAHLNRLGLDGRATPNPRHPHRVTIEPESKARKVSLDVFVHGRSAPGVTTSEIERALAPHLKASWNVTTISPVLEVGDVIATGAQAGELSPPALSDGARLCRFLRDSTAEFVLVASLGVTIESADWLARLLLMMQEPDVSVGCATVLLPDGSVSHAGWVLGPDGEMRPAMRGFDPDSDGFAGAMACAREISISLADFVLLRRSLVAAHLPIDTPYASADYLIADLVLRMTRMRLRAINVPYVRVRFADSQEAALSGRRIDALIFRDVWANSGVLGDPFYNPNFLGDRADYT